MWYNENSGQRLHWPGANLKSQAPFWLFLAFLFYSWRLGVGSVAFSRAQLNPPTCGAPSVFRLHGVFLTFGVYLGGLLIYHSLSFYNYDTILIRDCQYFFKIFCFVVGIIRHFFSETEAGHICIPQTYIPCGRKSLSAWSYIISLRFLLWSCLTSSLHYYCIIPIRVCQEVFEFIFKIFKWLAGNTCTSHHFLLSLL